MGNVLQSIRGEKDEPHLRLHPKITTVMICQHWFRTIRKDNNISLKSITNIIVMYYNITRVLKWKTKDGFEFTDDDRCATRIVDNSNYRWISPDIDPVKSGTHCWRINANHKYSDSNGGWVVYGVSPPDPNMDEFFGQYNVWGVSGNGVKFEGKGSKSGDTFESDSDFAHLYQKNIDVDVLLNLEQKILKIGIVGMIDKKLHEYIFRGIKFRHFKKCYFKRGKGRRYENKKVISYEFEGWIPHLNLYHHRNGHTQPKLHLNTAGCELRIVEIPCQWYRQELKYDIFECDL